MVDTMVAGASPDLYYEYYPYQDIQHLCPLPQDYGPVTVPMVSTNSSPPIAMPVQVPHGHVVQQIVDESGTLRHVILSPQPPPIVPMPQHFGGGNPNAANQPGGYFPAALSHGFGPFSPLQPGVIPHSPHPQGHSPPPHSYHKDERTQRQYNKLKKKLEQKQYRENHSSTPPLSPRKEINGNSRKGVGSVGTSEDGEESSLQDEEEEISILSDLLGTIKAPQVSEVSSRSALVQWSAPQVENPQDLSYQVLLSDHGKEGKYRQIYRGEALSCRIQDLRPGTEYSVCVIASVDDVVGCASEPTLFVTPPCKPDRPPPPKLASRNRSSLTLKWNAAVDNGAHIEHYIVEYEVNGEWTEVARARSKQAYISKLQPATPFTFRLAAVNQYGKSEYSDCVQFETCDSPPPQPPPPTLINASATSLTMSWVARPQDDEFTLQMEDPDTRHGYLAVYNGKETSFVCTGLKKNASYKFRLKSQNEEGCSRWSDEVRYQTLPGRPGPPSRPQLKGKVHSQSFRLRWDPPIDKGGANIVAYTVEIARLNSKDSDYKVVYSGANLSCTVERLLPGTAYQVRVCCEGPGGVSEFSEASIFATEPVCPGQCPPPRVQGKPRPHSISLKWGYPENDGGYPVTDLELGMKWQQDYGYAGGSDEPGEGELRVAYRGRDTECLVNDLKPAHLYTFMVRAINKVGSGVWSEPLEVRSGNAAPNRPLPPVVSASPNGSVTASWQPPFHNGAPISQYVLQMATPPGDNFSQVYLGSNTSCEVKPVPPATRCVFRLQACNSIGASDWSDLSSTLTCPGVPGPIPGLRAEPSPTTLHISWSQPVCNGEPVTHFNVEAGDFSKTVLDTECLIDNLTPSTQYRVRVRAVNAVGSGSTSSLKISTLALPPEPPQLTCTTFGHNYLKLRWGAANSNPHNHQYTVTMITSTSRKLVVYEGTNTTCKVGRLMEQTRYGFTIAASNSTGKGPESEVVYFSTPIAPPAIIKGVKICDTSSRGCCVEWSPLKSQGMDTIEYNVLCARLREQVFKQVYRGKESKCEIKDLEPGADYLVKVGAIRISSEGPVDGPFTTPISLSTPPLLQEHVALPQTRQHNHQASHRRPLSDQQWAGIIICCFTVVAFFLAILTASILY